MDYVLGLNHIVIHYINVIQNRLLELCTRNFIKKGIVVDNTVYQSTTTAHVDKSQTGE